MNENKKPLGARLGEGFFCIFYLIFVFTAVFVFRSKGINASSDTDKYRYVQGMMMAIILGCGDAFHLIPRIIVNFKGKLKHQEIFLGTGNLISSISMTIYYIFMMVMCDTIVTGNSGYEINYIIEKAIIILALIRILLCFFPQNKWFNKEGNKKWAIIRNVPFSIIGILMIALLIRASQITTIYLSVFYIQLAISVLFSFLFYLPVAIWGREKPKLGMLMIPKTLCYIWMLLVILLA
ncbi:MAG: hypothetical protein IJV15_08360 [Lachnospiraceae bacterium]|nr:hypothetical protein [Lachnospiraceae bacterium]